MRTFLSSLLLVGTALLNTVYAESWPGYRFPATIKEQTTSRDEKSTIWIIEIQSDDPRKDSLHIRFDNKTRQVAEAIWMTKGMYPLPTPSFGIYIPDQPSDDSKPVVILSEEKLKTAQFSEIAFVHFIWVEPTDGSTVLAIEP